MSGWVCGEHRAWNSSVNICQPQSAHWAVVCLLTVLVISDPPKMLCVGNMGKQLKNIFLDSSIRQKVLIFVINDHLQNEIYTNANIFDFLHWKKGGFLPQAASRDCFMDSWFEKTGGRGGIFFPLVIRCIYNPRCPEAELSSARIQWAPWGAAQWVLECVCHQGCAPV